ncbi:HDOD domain-containing protein [Pleionea sp. CnH1-48]|uniref:HDOD domain-containing protein n=1 Tax=Pleionea sp. CnH1-48 TaxID=2954494 RepID=UPI002096F269|nr:HDOD domain-containing protein [Pleionea sp. CnH1-48]MCO7227191.1 HDOD domain-containing protein [Pleionea sp. CnH1-48]
MSKQTLLLQIHRDLVAGNVQLPALPRVSLKVKEAAADPDQDIESLSQIVQVDPAFCGYLIRIANSPLYRRTSALSNVGQALGRLGMETTRNLAMTYAVRSVFSARNRFMARWLEQLWKQTIMTAALAHIMAERCSHLDTEEALMAALFQDIGALPLIEKASKYPELLKDDEAVKWLIAKYSATVGVAILHHWGLGKHIQEVARSREDWMRVHEGEADLADLITLARLHSYIGTSAMKTLPRINEIPAFHKLSLGEVGPSQSFEFVDIAKERIQQIRQALVA